MEYWQILVLAGIAGVMFFLGMLYGEMLVGKKQKSDGTLLIEQKEDRDVFRWVFETDLEEIKMKEKLHFNVQKVTSSQESQLL